MLEIDPSNNKRSASCIEDSNEERKAQKQNKIEKSRLQDIHQIVVENFSYAMKDLESESSERNNQNSRGVFINLMI